MRRSSMLASLALALIVFASAAAAAPTSDWSRWRGPNQDGIAHAEDVFGEAVGLEVVWKQPLGIAYSGIAATGDRLITMLGDKESDFLVALDQKTGKELWRWRIGETFPQTGGSEGGPASTPVIEGDTVYGLGPKGHLFAVGLADGRERWVVKIDEAAGARAAHFGFATTPLVVGDLLFVQTGGDQGRAFTAFDRATGKVLWSAGDDAVSYQSPILATVAGESQILAPGNTRLFGIEPRTGKVLWSVEHRTSEDDGHATPVLLGDDRVLIGGMNEAAAFQVARGSSGLTATEIWRTTDLKRSFAAPVLHEGHLYGFDGDFLTCVDATTGKKVWKSRPPGGNGLILVDDHLIVFSPDGEVVVAEASPEGYREKARTKVTERGGSTWPTFAAGAIFVRNTVDVASVRPGALAKASASVAPAAPASAFERFVREVESADPATRRLLVDTFMKRQERFPILEGDDLVHFVYRGDAEDVALVGTHIEYEVEEPLSRVEGTDLFWRTYRVEPGTRVEYRLNVDFENLQPDPMNPRRVPSDRGDFSELAMPGWSEPEFLAPYRGEPTGRMERFQLASTVLGNEREIAVWIPPGHAAGKKLPLVVVNDARGWTEFAALPNTLNHLVGRSVAPVVVVFVPRIEGPEGRPEWGGPRSADYVKMLAIELVPEVEKRYGTLAEPRQRAVLGAGSGALLAAYAVAKHPDVFGVAGGQSVYLGNEIAEDLLASVAELKSSAPRFWVSWSHYELRRAEWNIDLAEHSRRLRDALVEAGLPVEGGLVRDGAGWGFWRAGVADILETFFPAAGARAGR